MLPTHTTSNLHDHIPTPIVTNVQFFPALPTWPVHPPHPTYTLQLLQHFETAVLTLLAANLLLCNLVEPLHQHHHGDHKPVALCFQSFLSRPILPMHPPISCQAARVEQRVMHPHTMALSMPRTPSPRSHIKPSANPPVLAAPCHHTCQRAPHDRFKADCRPSEGVRQPQ
mgnify:CR=1 FL=1